MRKRVSEHNLRFYVDIMLKLYNTLGDCCFILFHFFIFAYNFLVHFYHNIMWYLYIMALKCWPFLLHLPQKIKCFSGTENFICFVFLKKYDIKHCKKCLRYSMLRFSLVRMKLTFYHFDLGENWTIPKARNP